MSSFIQNEQCTLQKNAPPLENPNITPQKKQIINMNLTLIGIIK